MTDLLNHDNAAKWLRSYRSLPQPWKAVVGLLIAVLIVGGIVYWIRSGQVASLRAELDEARDERNTARNERDAANQKIIQLNADYAPLRTAAVLTYGKADPESLSKLADDLSALRTAWSNAEVEAKQLRGEIRQVRARTERAVEPKVEEELITLLRPLPKTKVGLKRYEHTAEAVRFSEQLQTIFKKSGFDLTVHPPEFQDVNIAHLTGQLFQCNRTNHTPVAMRIFDALNKAGMNLTGIDQPAMSSNEIEIAIFRLSK